MNRILNPEWVCAICQYPMTDAHSLTSTICGNVYHHDCFVRAIRRYCSFLKNRFPFYFSSKTSENGIDLCMDLCHNLCWLFFFRWAYDMIKDKYESSVSVCMRKRMIKIHVKIQPKKKCQEKCIFDFKWKIKWKGLCAFLNVYLQFHINTSKICNIVRLQLIKLL